jgi:hypothetical protein
VEINSAGLKPGDLFTLSIQVPQPVTEKRNEETDMENYEFTLKYHLGKQSVIVEVQKNVFPVWMIQRIRVGKFYANLFEILSIFPNFITI